MHHYTQETPSYDAAAGVMPQLEDGPQFGLSSELTVGGPVTQPAPVVDAGVASEWGVTTDNDVVVGQPAPWTAPTEAAAAVVQPAPIVEQQPLPVEAVPVAVLEPVPQYVEPVPEPVPVVSEPEPQPQPAVYEEAPTLLPTAEELNSFDGQPVPPVEEAAPSVPSYNKILSKQDKRDIKRVSGHGKKNGDKEAEGVAVAEVDDDPWGLKSLEESLDEE